MTAFSPDVNYDLTTSSNALRYSISNRGNHHRVGKIEIKYLLFSEKLKSVKHYSVLKWKFPLACIIWDEIIIIIIRVKVGKNKTNPLFPRHQWTVPYNMSTRARKTSQSITHCHFQIPKTHRRTKNVCLLSQPHSHTHFTKKLWKRL